MTAGIQLSKTGPVLYPLPPDFYQRQKTIQIAKELIGKVLITHFSNEITAARICETEAYAGIEDKASHSYNNRKTKRTEIMYAPGGVVYIYLCYGIHHLFNVVTNKENIPHAILIRAGIPVAGEQIMAKRMNYEPADIRLTRGPGNLSRALGLHKELTGTSLQSNMLFITDDGYQPKAKDIICTPRIGVDYAGADALLPYRFYLKNCIYVSMLKNKPAGK